jgi:hypothetical protein
MTENLRGGFRRALLQPCARDFQFYENTWNVWANHGKTSNNAGHSDNFGCDWNFLMIRKCRKYLNKILRRIINPNLERYDYKVCIRRRKRYVTVNFVGAWIFSYICVRVFNVEHLKHDKFGFDWHFWWYENFRKEDLEIEKNHRKSKNIRCGFEGRNNMWQWISSKLEF